MEHNRKNFGAMLESIIGNLKSIIGSGLVGGVVPATGYFAHKQLMGYTKSKIECHVAKIPLYTNTI